MVLVRLPLLLLAVTTMTVPQFAHVKDVHVYLMDHIRCSRSYPLVYLRADISPACFEHMVSGERTVSKRGPLRGGDSPCGASVLLVDAHRVGSVHCFLFRPCEETPRLSLIVPNTGDDSVVFVTYNMDSACSCLDTLSWTVVSKAAYARAVGQPVKSLDSAAVDSVFSTKGTVRMQRLEIRDTSCAERFRERHIHE
jgi:hypothetical protein